MSYMLLIIEEPGDRRSVSRKVGEERYDRMVQFAGDLQSRGLLVGAESLAAHGSATRISRRGGRQTMIDGPFTEAKEMVGGFFHLNCRSRDEAIAIAELCPAVEWATVEVRSFAPCWDDSV